MNENFGNKAGRYRSAAESGSGPSKGSDALVEASAPDEVIVRSIKSIRRDPTKLLSDQDQERLKPLFGEGKRPERRQFLLGLATKYLFLSETSTEEDVKITRASLTGPVHAMVEYMVRFWNDFYREKTWIDKLDATLQLEYESVQKRYKSTLSDIHIELLKHINAYRDASKKCKLRELQAREEVKRWLRSHDATEAPMLQSRGWEDVEDALSAQLELSGLGAIAAEMNRGELK